jgi:signal transduction histidine kinase
MALAKAFYLTRLKLRAFALLYQDSVVHRFLGFNDQVRDLQASPPGMFFYNQRAIFFACSGLLLIITGVLILALGADTKEIATLGVMSFFWLVAAGVTLAFHPSFIRRIRHWSESAVTSRLPPLFARYFVIDFVTVFAMIFIGRIRGLNLDVFAFLLVANTIVYSAYIGGGRGFSLLVPGILYLLLVLTFLFLPFPATSIMSEPPVWFNASLYLASLLSMLVVSVISVTVISWLRSREYQTTQRQLESLGAFEDLLASASIQKQPNKKEENYLSEFGELRFRQRMRQVLDELCSNKIVFWYHSACLWFEKNRDGKPVLLPGPNVNFDEAHDLKEGIDADEEFLSSERLVIINSMKYRRGRWQTITPRFRSDLDAPAAFVPLRRGEKRIGVLALYGKEGELPPPGQDRAFLKSLASIISNTMEQWEGRFKAFPHRDMNELFTCQSLDQVFPRVVTILQRYLRAGACEVIFKSDERGKSMSVVAALGFAEDRIGKEYEVGRGKTGTCAEKGVTIRVDNVEQRRLEGFDPDYLEALERAHGDPITSWMAIPIGRRGHNHGVIKVVNRTAPWPWFTDDDQELGEDLALRLQVIIQKFLYVKRTEEAKIDSERQTQQAKLSASKASVAQTQAEGAARQLKNALMTMTHQLQGPLNPVVGALSGLQLLTLPKTMQQDIELAKALAESCLTLCWGTSATFAKLIGQKVSFAPDEIDAPAEMRKLCLMLQLANTDNELDFKYKEDDDFPRLRINRAVFTSVLFSLIHNAMKYAEKASTVYLECTFERDTGEAALKVKSVGVRIYPHEKETIFKAFERGRDLKNSSLRYNGTGLGLWVARELMLSVGGDLTVELTQDYPDLSVFVVHIPGGEQKPLKQIDPRKDDAVS